MSATGRSDVRREQDCYVTPNWCVRRFLEVYHPPGGVWLDPCAARGELLSVVKEMRPEVCVLGIEIRPECLPDLLKVTNGRASCMDFLTLNTSHHHADAVLTNFPFSLAEAFLTACLQIAPIVITLQRINWIRGNGRHALMARLRPGLFILPDRPSFDGRGTDSTEYGFFCFGDPAVAGTWTMLAETPLEERSAWGVQARLLHEVVHAL